MKYVLAANDCFCKNTHLTSFRILFAAFLMLFLFIGLIPVMPNAYAHAFIIKSIPSASTTLDTPPSRVDVYFSNPIDIKYSQLKVLDSSGNQVDTKDVKNIDNDAATLTVILPAGLKDGVYTVTTKVLDATDGHVTETAFVFGVGQSPTSAGTTSTAASQFSLLETLARFPSLVGQVFVVGTTFAAMWMWRPVLKIDWLKHRISSTKSMMDKRLIKLLLVGSIIVVVSDLGMIFVQANSIGTDLANAISTKFGNVWLLRMVLSATVLAGSIGLYRKFRMKSMSHNRNNLSNASYKKQFGVIFVLSMGLLATTSLISHGASTGQVVPIIIDYIHNVVASIWIGGVFYLALVLMPVLKKSDSSDDYSKVSVLSVLIPQFSVLVVTLLGIIVITGPFLLYILESDLSLTLASIYGKILILKLIFAGIMLALGAYNQTRIHKRALRLTAVPVLSVKGGKEISRPGNKDNGSESGDTTSTDYHNLKIVLRRFSNSTKIEAAIGIALLASVAALVNTGTPASQFQNILQQPANAQGISDILNQQQFTETRFADNASRIVLSIDPYIPGNNIFNISFLDENKNPLDIQSSNLKMTQVDANIGPITVASQKVSKGVYSAKAAFGLPGHWSLRVEGIPSKANMPNIVVNFDDLIVKPKLSQLSIGFKEFKISDNASLPFYPVYDNIRNRVWTGDTKIDSGRIWEFDPDSTKFVEHKIGGVSIITFMALDSRNTIWYVDPLMKKLGNYNPSEKTNHLYNVSSEGIISAIAVDDSNNIIWLALPDMDQIIRFDIRTHSFLPPMKLPTAGSRPADIKFDTKSGQLWVAEELGKIANINPDNNFKITEYSPNDVQATNSTGALASPTALAIDPVNENVYISEHEGHAVSIFNPFLKTFNKFPLNFNPDALPFGMAIDKFYNLWVAQHTYNKIAVLDTRTGQFKEAEIPSPNSFTQWITADTKGNIWMAEQRAGAIGMATIKTMPSPQEQSNNNNGINTAKINNADSYGYLGVVALNFSYSDILGPAIASGIFLSALLFTKSTLDLNKSIQQVKKNNARYSR